MEELDRRVSSIEQRNQRVELDKAWETSLTRIVVILVLTYGVMALFLWSVDTERPFVNAFIPSIAFVVSTLTLPFVKRWWIRK